MRTCHVRPGLALALLSLAAVPLSRAQPARPYRRTGLSLPRVAATVPSPDHASGSSVGWVSSRIDHFSADAATYQQRYFINSSVYKPGGPVFLCVGGEGPPLTEDVVETGGLHCALMVHLAVQNSALILALEHRYYGMSQPFPDLSTPNLRFLSSRQALQDIALFHEHITSLVSLPQGTKWVTFGGSYPGMLAAWARSKFPHLFHASVSSSSPVEAILNMQGYNDVTASSLADGMVGGSAQCLSAVKAGFADIGVHMTTSAGRRKLEKVLNVCGAASSPPILEDPRSRALLTEAAADPLIPQSNDPACTEPVCDIRRQCEVLTNTTLGTPFERLVQLNSVARAGACLNANYFEMLDGLKDVSLSEDRTDRVWFYQTCSEFAFYQTCDPDSHCPFTSKPHLNTVESYTLLCKLVYDIEPETVAELVNQTNAVYGGREISATRILWVNGLIDPWRAQAVTKSIDPKARPAIIVPGASHHFWTHPAKPTDSPFVVKARLQIGEFVSKALSEPADSQKWEGGAKFADVDPQPEHVGERMAKKQRSQERASRDRLQGSSESPTGSKGARDVGAEGKEKEVTPTNYMTNNDRLPGVPLAPFQVIQRYRDKSSLPNL